MEDHGIGPPPSCIVASFQRDAGNQLLVLESGGFTYLSVSKSVDERKLCFLDHRMESWDAVSDMCCLRGAGHVHAHVHHGDLTEDILLEQCMEETGCTLPMPLDTGGIRTPICSGDGHESDHEHQEGCGHNQIAHGDHFDWLIPLKDGSGSYVLKHAQATANGVSQFIEHGRLVKVGESLGQLKRRPKQPIIDLFTYEGPNRKGYEVVAATEDACDTDIVAFMKSPSSGCLVLSSPRHAAVGQEDTVRVTIPRSFKGSGTVKTTLDVMGLCCPSEVPLVKKILEPLPGVEEVLVNLTSKTVTVLHDPTITADVQLVKVLNQARLDASIHERGNRRKPHKWPSPWTIGSGILLAISFGHYAWSPLKWVALGSVAVGVPPIAIRSLVALRRWVLDINALMIIAVVGAIALGDYVEAGSICFLFTLAGWLESRSSDKACDAIANVANLAPQTAVLMDGQRVNVEDVNVGTLLAVKAGELIPIDGEVVSGKSSIDESNVTGESKPVEKTMGTVVWAGTTNLSGYISIKTTALAEDSAVSRMVRLVEEAQNQQSRTEQIVEKVAKYYTPLVVVGAILIATIPLAAGSHRTHHWIYLALVLLVVACPCALVISTPVTTTCGIAQAARSGLLVRGGSHLDALAKVKVLAMDKTGTMTEGHFRVLDVKSTDITTSVQQILYWITCVESKSSHPLAPALVEYARLHGVEPTGDISDFEIIPGLGVSAIVDGSKVQIGNARLAANFIGFEGSNSEIVEKWSGLGATIGWVGVDERPVGVFGVADSVRPEAIEAVASLKSLGLRIVMLTGDSAAAASIVHTQIGDIEVHSELLPEDKVKLVKELKATGVTAMVGDGINDAPALALADVGIAMGVAGSAVAMETADVALMTNDLRKIAVAIKLGRNVRMKILQTVSLSLLTKIAIIVLAAAGHPSLWASVLADVGTCLVVIFNSIRLLHRKKGIVLPKFESKKQQGKHHGHDNRSASEITPASNCCTKPVMGKECSVAYSRCSTGTEQESTPSSNLYLTPRASEGTAAGRQCCSGQDRKWSSSNADKKLKGTYSKQCCSAKKEQVCCSILDVKLKSAFGSECFSGQDNGKKHDAISNMIPEVGLGNQCCSGQGKEKKSCSNSDRSVAPSGSECFSGQDNGKKHDIISKMKPEVGLGNQCCSREGKEKKSCSNSDRSPAPSGSECFSGQDNGEKHGAISNMKPEVGLGNQCCSGEGKEKKPCSNSDRSPAPSGSQCCSCPDSKTECCSNSETKLQASSNSPCCFGQNVEKKCCSISGEKVKGASGSQCCCGQYRQKKCCSSLDKKSGVSGSQFLSEQDVDKKCGNHTVTNPHGKLAGSETLASCGMSNCKFTDHSCCSTEALLHSPVRDFSSFNRPVSPLN